MFDVFEQPWGLLVTAIVVLFALLVFRSISPQKKRWWQWLLPVLFAGTAFGLDHFVKTDNEKIKAVIKTVTKAVEQERANVVEAFISENYSDSYHNTSKILISRLRYRLSKPLIEKNITRILTIDIQQSDATAVFTVRIVFDKQSHIHQNFKAQTFVKVKMNLQKELDKRWLIKQAELLELDLQPVNWQDIRQYW